MTIQSSKDQTQSRRAYRMTKRADQAATTRARIVEVAAEALRSGEFAEISLDELARRAGTTRATVYRSLGSKASLLEAITWDVLASVRLDKLDEAHNEPDVAVAVRRVLYENCRMFSELGDLLPIMLDHSRRDDETAAIINATYHGRRHQAMERLARRIAESGQASPGWQPKRIANALLVLTSYEAFETLTRHRNLSIKAAAAELDALARAFVNVR